LKRTKEEAEQTKRKLINIALNELIKHGSESITLESIAAKAGVTRGAIYWHFNNKEDLLDNLIKMKDADSLELMENILKSNKPPMKKLELLISGNFPKFKTQKEMKHYAKLKLDLYNHYLRYGDNRNVGKTYVKTAAAIIKQAQAEGKIKKEINAEDAA
jgi:AcrR family transcriptional regulator